MTTTVAYADDGGVIVSSATTYSPARTGAFLVPNATDYVGQSLSAGGTFGCLECVLNFDTSAVGSDDVLSATLEVYVRVNSSDGASGDVFVAEARLLSSFDPTTINNWVQGASLGGQTLLATMDTTGLTEDAYNAFTSESAFLTAINGSGDTVILLNSDQHRIGNAPASATLDYFTLYVETDSAARLTITHSPHGTGTIAASLQPLTSALSGSHSQTGTVAAALAPLTSALAGIEHPRGAIVASLAPLTADLSDRADNTIVSTIQPLTAALSGSHGQTGTITATLQPLTISIAGAYLGIVQTAVRPGRSGGAPSQLRPRGGGARR